MIVMILEKVPPSLRGELSRWLFEIKTGIYVGHVSALVREKLWDHCSSLKGAGGVIQIWSTNTEQRYAIRISGVKNREVVDWEGLSIIREFSATLNEVQKRRISEER